MRTVTVLFSMGALVACGERAAEPVVASDAQAMIRSDPLASVDAPRASPEDAMRARIAADLERLADLRVVEIGEPTAGARHDEASVARLDRFTALAEEAAAIEREHESADRDVVENIAALRSLEIVEVESLVYDEPSRASHCYGPCPPTSKAEHRRAVQLAHIVAATKGL